MRRRRHRHWLNTLTILIAARKTLAESKQLPEYVTRAPKHANWGEVRGLSEDNKRLHGATKTADLLANAFLGSSDEYKVSLSVKISKCLYRLHCWNPD